MKNLKNCTVTVMVSNMDTAIEFYIQILGLKLKKRYGDHYAEIEAPGLLIGLHPTSDKIKTGNNFSLGFGVVDFNSTKEFLEVKGIDFKEAQDGGIRLAHFKDPDNNQLYLAEIKN